MFWIKIKGKIHSRFNKYKMYKQNGENWTKIGQRIKMKFWTFTDWWRWRLHIISLIPRLSHRLSYVTFRTISWSWNSSPNYFMALALRVHLLNTHESYVCRAKCRVCGTVKSELHVGQWIRINIGRAQLKRNLDLISVFHCHCPRAQLLAAHTAVHQS